MRVLNVRPKGIYIDLEFSMEQLNAVKEFLNHATCEFNSESEPEMVQISQYVQKEFYPDLEKLLEEINRGT